MRCLEDLGGLWTALGDSGRLEELICASALAFASIYVGLLALVEHKDSDCGGLGTAGPSKHFLLFKLWHPSRRIFEKMNLMDGAEACYGVANRRAKGSNHRLLQPRAESH